MSGHDNPSKDSHSGKPGGRRGGTGRRHSDRMLYAAIHGSPIPQFVIDAEHRVVQWNRALEVLTGVSADAVVGTTRQWSAFYPAERPCLADLLVDGRADEVPAFYPHSEWSTLIHDGVVGTSFIPRLGEAGRLLHFLATTIRDGDGTIIGAVETLQDISDRAQAEEALRESEERYRAVFDAANDAIMIHELGSGIVVNCNRRTEELYGYSRDEMRDATPESCSTLIPPYTAEAAMEYLRRAAEEGPQLFEWHAKRRSGEAFWVEVSLKRVDIGGEPFVVAAVREIGERKKAAAAVRRAEEELSRILDSSSEIITHFAPDLRILWANRTASESARTSSEEMQGRYCYEFYHQRREPCVDCPVLRARETGQAQEGELTTADGRTWYIRGYPVKGEDGGIVGLSEFRLDITERKRAEEARRASEERYRRIVQAVTDYIYTVHVANGAPVDTRHGPGCVAVTGYAAEEFAADPSLWLSMVVEEDRELVLDAGRRVLAGESPPSIEHRIVRKDGAVRWVRSTTSTHWDADGRVLSYDGLVQDITEQKRLQDQLLRAQKMEAVGRLAGGIAHDFNNLLTAIIGYANLLRPRLGEDGASAGYLTHIERAGERAAELTRQLLAFARRQVAEPKLLSLNPAVCEAERVLVPLMREDIHVRLALCEDLWTVEADPGQLQQVIVNMALNARDAMPGGGELTISTSNRVLSDEGAQLYGDVAPGAYVELAVSDTGVGMNAEVQSHLFEPFFTTKPPGQGTGLGLATCHGIVQQSGGHIRVYSEAGRGTTFRVLLPRAARSMGSDTMGTEPAEPVRGGTETILLAEDQPDVRALASQSLRAVGYRVIEAANGTEAVALALDNLGAIDLLVTDVIMPGMSGREVADRLLEHDSQAKVLFMSGHAESAVAHHGVLDPGIAFLPKPFAPDDLARKVREVLDSR